MYNERLHTKDLISQFNKSCIELLEDLETILKGLKKSNESDRTMDYQVQKRMAAWFDKHGGLPL